MSRKSDTAELRLERKLLRTFPTDRRYHDKHGLLITSCIKDQENPCQNCDGCFFSPKPVIPVNFQENIVMSRYGGIQGPYTHDEWRQYSYKLFEYIYKGTEAPKAKDEKFDWRDLYFRAKQSFYAGSFYHFSEHWLVTVNALPDNDFLKHLTYSSVWSGVDLFHNQANISPNKSREFRNKGNFHTKSVPHNLHTWIHGKLDLSDPAFREKAMKWWPPYKNIPQNDRGEAPVAKTNPSIFTNYDKFLLAEIEKDCESGIMAKTSKKLVRNTTAWVVADEPLKKTRKCYDGGLLKILESHKTPCKLDTIPNFCNLINKNDLLSKIDDKSGFMQLILNADSVPLTGQRIGKTFFITKGAAFGIPRIPGDFQRANNAAVAFLQKLGVRCSLYLDDRGMVDEPFERASPFHAPKNAFLTCCACIAVGGFISLEKSELLGTTEMEFLGMILNTEKMSVKVPQRKWEKFLNRIEKIESKTWTAISSKTVQKIRGLAISFIFAIPLSRLYIRRQTEFIQQAWKLGYHEHAELKVPDRLVEELRWWKNQTYFEIECSWKKKDLTHLELKNIFTDSSSFAGGACILKNCGELTNVFTTYWGLGQSKLPIHIKEGLIIIKALEKYEHFLKNKLIHIYTDNMSVFHSSNYGCSDPNLNDIILKIHQKVFDLNSEIQFSFVPTKEQLADEPSRRIDYAEEIIDPEMVQTLEIILGASFDIDVMATKENKICEKFISKSIGEGTKLINFFTFKTLPEKNIWCFPPKVIADKALSHLLTYFRDKNFACIFHRFQEWPPAYLVTMKENNLKIIKLSDNGFPCTAIPVKKQQSDGWHPFFKRNRKPLETYAVVNELSYMKTTPRVTSVQELLYAKLNAKN